MIKRSENPKFLNEFLDYSGTIQNKSKGTITEYNYDLKHFIQYILYRYNDDNIPKDKLPEHVLNDLNNNNITVADAIKEISIKDEKHALLTKVELADIHAFLQHLKLEYNLKPASLGRKVASIRSFFKYHVTVRNTLENNPTVGLETPKQPKRLPKHLDLEQSERLLKVTKTPNSNSKISEELVTRNTAIITLLLNCGLRLSELVNINLKDLNFYDNTLNVVGKGNKERQLYLNHACLKALKNYLKDRKNDVQGKDADALFLSERKTRISRRTVQHIVKQELEKAGINSKEYSVHKLRHTAATLMFQYGDVDIRSLQKVLGHESVSTTEIYTHVNNEQVRNAISNNPLADIEKENNVNNEYNGNEYNKSIAIDNNVDENNA